MQRRINDLGISQNEEQSLEDSSYLLACLGALVSFVTMQPSVRTPPEEARRIKLANANISGAAAIGTLAAAALGGLPAAYSVALFSESIKRGNAAQSNFWYPPQTRQEACQPLCSGRESVFGACSLLMILASPPIFSARTRVQLPYRDQELATRVSVGAIYNLFSFVEGPALRRRREPQQRDQINPMMA